jgi:hypothetical protein
MLQSAKLPRLQGKHRYAAIMSLLAWIATRERRILPQFRVRLGHDPMAGRDAIAVPGF